MQDKLIMHPQRHNGGPLNSASWPSVQPDLDVSEWGAFWAKCQRITDQFVNVLNSCWRLRLETK